VLEDVRVRFLCRRLLLEVKDLFGDEGKRTGEKASGGDLGSDVVGVASNGAGAGIEGTLEMGATSFAMRASMKVRKVNETL
jgi:hypothetical protein